MNDLFISYSRKDTEFVGKLVEDLIASDISVWLDQREIDFGDLWEQKIQRALEKCDALMIILSPDSVNSRHVRDELSLSIENGKKIIPVMFRDCELPSELVPVNFADFRDNYEPALELLIIRLQRSAIESHATYAALPTRNPFIWHGAATFGRAILEEARRAAQEVRKIEDLWRGIDRATAAAVKAIEHSASAIDTHETIRSVATTACGDVEFGAMAAEAISRTSREGVIQVVETDTSNYTELKVIEDMHLSYGWASPGFVTDTMRQKAALNNPYILVCETSLSDTDLTPIITRLRRRTGSALVVIALGVADAAVSALLKLKASNKLITLAVSLVGAGPSASALLEDIAIRTGATRVSPDTGLSCSDLTLRNLGRAEEVVCDRRSMVIRNGAGRPKDVGDRISAIRAELEETRLEDDRDFLRFRIAMLVGSHSVITIGGPTRDERAERKRRMTMALRAASDAMETGFVAGLGVAPLNAKGAIYKPKTRNRDERRGINVVAAALEAPIKELAARTNKDLDSVLNSIAAEKQRLNSVSIGYDPRTGTCVDVIQAGLIEPAKMVQSALERGHDLARKIFLQ